MSRLILLFIAIVSSTISLNCQDYFIENIGNSKAYKKGTTFSNQVKKGNGINKETRIEVENILKSNQQKLLKKGTLKIENTKEIILELPIKLKEGLNDPGFYSISAYVDHNLNFPDQLQDYYCGDITYDADNGYNHEGTDYYLWPFPWQKMENNEVEVAAAAAGIILFKTDGNFDQNCNGEDLPWNAVYLQHDNGYITWYGHLKEGSLTNKFVGEEVEAGEYLGIVGSSGISVIPHLHFEVHDASGSVIDPFWGECNPELQETLWLDQIQYLESGINHIATNKTTPNFPDCPLVVQPNESYSFSGNDTIFLTAYYRNFLHNEGVNISILRPDGSVWQEWEWTNPLQFYTSSWNYWFIILNNELEGNWKYVLQHKNEIYEHEFYYTNEASIEESNIRQLSISPNPVISFTEILLKEQNDNHPELEIINIIGKQLQLPYQLIDNSSSIILDCNLLPTGIYLIRLKTDKYLYTGKLLKQ